MTTLFARLVLGDVFLHGIGGAKYDELTDRILEQFFGLTPPGYAVVSGTLRLPIAHRPATVDQLRDLRHQLRSLAWHPERFLADEVRQPAAHEGNGDAQAVADIAHWLEHKRRWIATEPVGELSRQRAREIGQSNAALQPYLEQPRAQLVEAAEQTARAVRAEAILSARNYAFCLYPAENLRQFLLAFPDGKA
jgi:hypothetical protein